MKNDRGFTLVELMISLVLFAIMMTGIYETYIYQQKAYMKQEQVADLQQGMRSALYFLKLDIRMAGYDPTGNAGSTVTISDIAEFQFQVDANGDGDFDDGAGGNDPNELIRYALTNDVNKDGVADGFPCNLGREVWSGGLQPVAENIQAIEFCYILEDGTITTDPAATELENIRGVYISILARTDSGVNKGNVLANVYTQASNDTILVPATQWDSGVSKQAVWSYGDSYVRKMLISKVRCRNMGLDPFGGL